MKSSQCRPGGFTLVEIMIVVAIISLLASIAIPNYVKSRERAHEVSCISNLKTIDGIVQQWAMDLRKDSSRPVSYSDISGYLRGSVVCPAGGTGFADSYALSTVETPPTCLRKPDTHKLGL
jgi:prepilin-type N-terminal cleavage/methylation domain-containing protein